MNTGNFDKQHFVAMHAYIIKGHYLSYSISNLTLLFIQGIPNQR